MAGAASGNTGGSGGAGDGGWGLGEATAGRAWGSGAVVLVEIPLDSEFHDNIVSFWKPAQPLVAGVRHDFAYEQRFGMAPGDGFPVARVRQTRSGRSVNAQGARSYFIDFDLDLFQDQPDPAAVVSASA